MNPILTGMLPAAFATLLAAVANFGDAFGLFVLTDKQLGAINGLFVAVIGTLIVLGAIYAHLRSTPVANPTLPAGTVVNVVQPGTTPNTTATV